MQTDVAVGARLRHDDRSEQRPRQAHALPRRLWAAYGRLAAVGGLTCWSIMALLMPLCLPGDGLREVMPLDVPEDRLKRGGQPAGLVLGEREAS
jgi:hypothetical protein